MIEQRITINDIATVDAVDILTNKFDETTSQIKDVQGAVAELMDELRIKTIEITFNHMDNDLLNLFNNQYISEDEYNLINYLFVKAKNRSLRGEVV